MQHFLQSVNHSRLMLFLGEVVDEEIAELSSRDIPDRDVDERREDAIRVQAQDAFERHLFMDPKRVDIFECVECLAADDTFVGDHELEFARISSDEEIADDADQDEGDRHEGTIGKNSVGNDQCEENGRYHEAAWIGPDMEMFRCAPRQKGIARENWFHREFLFLYYTMTFPAC